MLMQKIKLKFLYLSRYLRTHMNWQHHEYKFSKKTLNIALTKHPLKWISLRNSQREHLKRKESQGTPLVSERWPELRIERRFWKEAVFYHLNYPSAQPKDTFVSPGPKGLGKECWKKETEKSIKVQVVLMPAVWVASGYDALNADACIFNASTSAMRHCCASELVTWWLSAGNTNLIHNRKEVKQ